MTKESIYLTFDDNHLLSELLGECDKNLLKLEQLLGVTASSRGNKISITGDTKKVARAYDVLHEVYNQLEQGQQLEDGGLEALIRSYTDGAPKKKNGNGNGGHGEKLHDTVIKTLKKPIIAYTPTQAVYMQALKSRELVFGVGPAGTGKTYLAVAAAVSAFVEGKVDRIILSRPAVEAGEKLGFLPGDMREKVDPYLRPLYDALYDMMPPEKVIKYLETGQIEIAPLAFMRGRTLSNAFVILDEAQNSTAAQMKMFLTRLGQGTRMAVTGDLSQTDLPKGMKSGFRDALEKLTPIDEIAVVRFSDGDSVRHPLTTKIIQAYQKFEKEDGWKS